MITISAVLLMLGFIVGFIVGSSSGYTNGWTDAMHECNAQLWPLHSKDSPK